MGLECFTRRIPLLTHTPRPEQQYTNVAYAGAVLKRIMRPQRIDDPPITLPFSCGAKRQSAHTTEIMKCPQCGEGRP